MLAIPAGLLEQSRLGLEWVSWLDRLPGLLLELLEEWELVSEPVPAWHGAASVVVPVRAADGQRLALKVTFDGDDESLHEGLALQHWAGDGVVRLIRADPARRALLLERLHPQDLHVVDPIDACEVVARLYSRLHRPAMPQLRPLTEYLSDWLADLASAGAGLPLPRRMVQQALSLGGDLVSDPASVGVVIHGDLHYANVLAADREGWLVIDPKPMSGDPHYEPGPMLWNRWDEVVASGDVRSAVRRRFHTLVDVAELDEDRAREWVLVRSIINAGWTHDDAARAHRPLDADEQDWVTMCLAIAKAVQD